MELFASLSDSLNRWAENADLLRLGVVLSSALAVFLISLVIAWLIRAWSDPVKRRLDAQVAEYEAAIGTVTPDRDPNTLRLLERLGQGLVPLDVRKRSRIVIKLSQAGFRSNRAAPIFFASKIVGLLVLPLVVGASLWLLGMDRNMILMLSLLTLSIGILLPDYWLVKRVRKRQTVLRRALPEALDMMVVCVEAGLGLTATIQRVAKEIEHQHPQLSNEFTLTMVQMRAGLDTKTALEDMVQRTGVDEIKSLVGTLIQAIRFGTSIANTLRIFSDDMNDKRLKAAEEQAAKVGNKMIIPIAVFMIPAFLIIAIAPPLLDMGNYFGGGQ
ncbi:MAG: type II secretion system F family protein [Lamprobacter sp.]|uniref:type II secretion system F family protein n=1 Tax=Lamprobacter sp. TaxID=3100796 RepID=UPI002B2606B8|nr:type II secretion system F family protein [Lamprobacter sp.]MEA3640846.1 type II secretion system F family protein [Lamprobacter sp.]